MWYSNTAVIACTTAVCTAAAVYVWLSSVGKVFTIYHTNHVCCFNHTNYVCCSHLVSSPSVTLSKVETPLPALLLFCRYTTFIQTFFRSLQAGLAAGRRRWRRVCDAAAAATAAAVCTQLAAASTSTHTGQQ